MISLLQYSAHTKVKVRGLVDTLGIFILYIQVFAHECSMRRRGWVEFSVRILQQGQGWHFSCFLQWCILACFRRPPQPKAIYSKDKHGD